MGTVSQDVEMHQPKHDAVMSKFVSIPQDRLPDEYTKEKVHRVYRDRTHVYLPIAVSALIANFGGLIATGNGWWIAGLLVTITAGLVALSDMTTTKRWERERLDIDLTGAKPVETSGKVRAYEATESPEEFFRNQNSAARHGEIWESASITEKAYNYGEKALRRLKNSITVQPYESKAPSYHKRFVVKKAPSVNTMFDPTMVFRKRLIADYIEYDVVKDLYFECKFYSSVWKDEKVTKVYYGPRFLFNKSLNLM